MRRSAVIILVVMLITVLLNPFTALDANAYIKWVIPTQQNKIDRSKLGPYEKVAENEYLELYYRKGDSSIKVKDKRTGFVWENPEDISDAQVKGNTYIQNNITTPFYYKYADPTAKTLNEIPAFATENMKENMTKIKNGIRVEYDLPDPAKIKLTIEYTLDGDSLVVYIPADKIEEYDKNYLIAVEPLPFFGGAYDDEEGYVFYPDGSGAISYFKKIHPEYFQNYFQGVYGSDEINLNVNLFKTEKDAMLPVFGIKRGNNAILGIIDQGDYDAYIEFSPSGYQIELNRVAAYFVYRRTYNASLESGALVKRLEKNLIATDRKVIYKFLVNEEADYNGMANAYRDYLIKKENLKPVVKKGDNIPLVLSLFMGIEEHQVLRDKFIAMTTFEQGERILKEFKEKGVDSIVASLMGWTKRGYMSWPTRFPVSGKLGGKRGLAQLAATAKDLGYKLLLRDNLVDAYASIGHYSNRDVAYQANQILPVSDTWGQRHVFSPEYILKFIAAKVIPRYAELEVDGISYERFGSFLYFDYNRRYKKVDRTETAEYWNSIMSDTREKIGFTGVHGGNAYALKNADMIFEIPHNDSNYFFSDESVPFYQMVVHGLLPYAGSPINLFYDHKAQLLRQIEYGFAPHYMLTHEKSDKLMYTDYNILFSSNYDMYIDQAIEIYKDLNENLKDLWTEKMIRHEKIEENLYCVTYSNGAKVYVNYNSEDKTVDGKTVKALDYLVVGGE